MHALSGDRRIAAPAAGAAMPLATPARQAVVMPWADPAGQKRGGAG
jgi:hypothetical protein